MKTVSRLENIDFIYGGQAGKQNGQWVFAGEVDLKAPDFVQLVNDFNFNYKPKAFSLGIFTLASKVSGTADKFRLTGLNAFVGSNNFKGELAVDRSLGRPNITARMDVNKFELERFFTMMRRVRRIRLISAPAKPRMPLLLPVRFGQEQNQL